MLDRESVYVWRVELDATASEDQIDSWIKLLSPEELWKANTFRLDVLRREYVGAHAALRFTLGKCLGIPSAAVRFVEGSTVAEAGSRIKPTLMASIPSVGDCEDLRFSLSHTRGFSLIAVAVSREVGVDIERQRPMEDLEPVAASVMSAEELRVWETLRPEDRLQAFFNLWTRKEAYLKAIGLGLSHSLQSVTVPLSVSLLDPSMRDYAIVEDGTRPDKWELADLPVPEAYSASICWEGKDLPRIVVQDLDLNSVV